MADSVKQQKLLSYRIIREVACMQNSISKYSLDKELKDLGGIWSRVDFKNGKITPWKVRVLNGWFRIGSGLQPLAGGVRRKKRYIPLEGKERVPVTIYEPAGIGDRAPCLIYYHGGAFVLGARPATHRLAQAYAYAVGCRVALIHYRIGLSYPQPVMDCYRGLVWVAGNAERLGIDRSRIAVLGDSAGGALAAAITQLARDRKGPEICFQMLISPVTDSRMTSWSMREFVDAPRWNAKMNRRMWEIYLQNNDGRTPRYASPMAASSLKGLPPAYVETLEIDCLRDEGNAYADRMSREGVPVELNEIRGTFNGYDQYDKNTLVKLSLKRRCLVLKKEFSQRGAGA